jgi:hypothetical protein
LLQIYRRNSFPEKCRNTFGDFQLIEFVAELCPFGIKRATRISGKTKRPAPQNMNARLEWGAAASSIVIGDGEAGDRHIASTPEQVHNAHLPEKPCAEDPERLPPL